MKAILETCRVQELDIYVLITIIGLIHLLDRSPSRIIRTVVSILEGYTVHVPHIRHTWGL